MKQLNFWKDGFSLDESKSSMLMFLSFLCTIFALIMYWFNQEIGDNLFKIVQTCLLSIAGVTGVKSLEGIAASVFSKNEYEDTNEEY